MTDEQRKAMLERAKVWTFEDLSRTRESSFDRMADFAAAEVERERQRIADELRILTIGLYLGGDGAHINAFILRLLAK